MLPTMCAVAVQTTYMESGKAHRKLTECAANVCKGTAPIALVASRSTTSPEDSENLTRAATLLSEQVTFLLQIAQGLSAADVLTVSWSVITRVKKSPCCL